MTERILSITPQLQKTDYWCWATIASMLSEAYHHPMSQCQVAGAYLHKDCCTDEVSCYQSAELNTVLTHFEFSNENDYVGNAVSFEYLKYEVDHNKPVAIRVTDGGFSHYVLLVGYSEMDASKMVNVIDPRYGTVSSKNFNDLANAIYPDSEWSHTYLIHPLP
jgi:hypothetical protein